MPRPVFLSLDGLDGTGKTTQCALLVDWLRSQKVPVTPCVDPGGTELGQKLREILLFGRQHAIGMRAEALLFMASRAQLVEEVIRPTLDRGEVVVSDRYLLANVVYQGHAGGLDPAELWSVGSMATGGLEPDLTIVFDLPLEDAYARRGGEADRLESRDLDFHQAVKRGFLFEAGRRPDRHRIVDAAPEPALVQKAVRKDVARKLAEHGWSLETEG